MSAILVAIVMVMSSVGTVNVFAANSIWYSQLGNSIWSATNLNNLYFPTYSSTTPFLNSSKPFIMNEGCVVTSYAMVLHNMGKTTTQNRYDFRDGSTKKQPADPFTVTMANIGWSTISSGAGGKYTATGYTSSQTPVYAYHDNIQNEFGVKGYTVNLEGLSDYDKQSLLVKYIKKNPEGILVRLGGWHTIVFNDTSLNVARANSISDSLNIEPVLITKENQDELFKNDIYKSVLPITKSPQIALTGLLGSGYTVCDPGTTNSAKGSNVDFNSSYSYGAGLRLSDANYLIYLD